MTVPAALKELEKIELLKGGDGDYILDYAVTATQKAILKAFDMTSENVQIQAREISSDLTRIRMEALAFAIISTEHTARCIPGLIPTAFLRNGG